MEDKNLEELMEISPKENETTLEDLTYYEKEEQQIFEENNDLNQMLAEQDIDLNQLFENQDNDINQLLDIQDNELTQLLAIQDDAKTNLAIREGFQNYEVIKVVHYYDPVKLVNKETGDVEELDLSVAIAQDSETLEIIEIYYIDGKEADLALLMKEYESPMPIKDLIDNEEPDLELYDEREKEELIEIIEFEDSEEEKDEEHGEKTKHKEEDKNIMKTRPLNIIQRIDPHTTYVNGLQTVSKVFNLSTDVHELVVAYPQQGDNEVLSASITLYMLDKNGNVLEKSNGKKIKELFEMDRATGINSISDDSTRRKLDGTVEQNANRTMARFKSKEDNASAISIDQKKTLDHHQVYAGKEAINTTDNGEVELDRKDNGSIQTNLNAQKVVDYGDGTHKEKEVADEANKSVENGADKENITIEEVKETSDSIYIPGTEKTWEELSEETGENIAVLQERFEREIADGKEAKDIVDEIEYDYEMTGHEHERRLF